jgi:hypothetical protein
LEAFRLEGFRALEGVRYCLGDRGVDLDAPLGLVELDSETERLEALPLDLGRGFSERVSEVLLKNSIRTLIRTSG